MGIKQMNETLTKTQAFKLKGRLYTLTVIQLLSADEHLFKDFCAQTVHQAPKMFEGAPVVFDLTLVTQFEFDLSMICKIARSFGMVPVAIQGGSPLQVSLAQCQGLAVMNASSSQDKPYVEQPLESASIAFAQSKLVTTPVRSGRQVVAKGSDLIVTSSVSHGAELLADGSIHIYGVLRGRALAGMSGDENARIFCQSLEAELVSIAGFYRLSDAIQPMPGPCQIYLVDQHIHIEPL